MMETNCVPKVGVVRGSAAWSRASNINFLHALSTHFKADLKLCSIALFTHFKADFKLCSIDV